MNAQNIPYPFIDASSLLILIEQNSPTIILDCRYKLTDPLWGRQVFEESHIPGAIFVDVNTELSGEHIASITGRHPLPSDQELNNLLNKFSINKETEVVVYDEGFGESAAARMWWILRYLNIENVSVLYGGFTSWSQKLTLEFNENKLNLPPENENKKLRPFKIDKAALLNSLEEPKASTHTLIDVRANNRYRGLNEPIDPIAGHIPGAVNLPYENLLPYLNSDFLDIEKIRETFLNVSKNQPENTIFYCGSGITACFTILLYYTAFQKFPVLYPGSWSEWIAEDNPHIEVSK